MSLRPLFVTQVYEASLAGSPGFEAFHAAFYRSVEATSVTPFTPRALDRALPAIVVALGRHGQAALTPPRGALGAADHRAALGRIADILVSRARAHRSMDSGQPVLMADLPELEGFDW